MKLKVRLENVSKSFSMHSKQSDKLLELFSLKKKKEKKEFYAVNNVSFKVYEGETVGIIGLNGSGKSTLSNILAEVIQPTSGKIGISGETSLIAISAGLNVNLSGVENIDLKCMMHGLSKEEIEKVKPDIFDFADIGDYIYQPVKNYSSGMKSRLGFAIAVHTNPDILIIDEALSVGDSTFTQKCIEKMEEFKKQGKTIFFISHSASQVKTFCEKVIWMHYGQVKEVGDSASVIYNYTKFVKWFNNLSTTEKKKYKNEMLQSQVQRVQAKQHVGNNSSIRTFKSVLKNLVLITPLLAAIVLLLMGY